MIGEPGRYAVSSSCWPACATLRVRAAMRGVTGGSIAYKCPFFLPSSCLSAGLGIQSFRTQFQNSDPCRQCCKHEQLCLPVQYPDTSTNPIWILLLQKLRETVRQLSSANPGDFMASVGSALDQASMQGAQMQSNDISPQIATVQL